MDKKDYIIEGDEFIAYVGKPDIVDFEIPEQWAQCELSNKLDSINKSISESNKNSDSGSYDVYDNEGTHIGRIDKK